MKFIYLDVDGVLNDHKPHPNGYCGTHAVCVARLNRLLQEVPDAQLVISSAWRYLVHKGDMTPRGLESLLMTHGLACHGRVFGVTEPDEPYMPPSPSLADYERLGCEVRARQITEHVACFKPGAWVVLDDLPVPVERLVRVDGQRGLDSKDVDAAREWLR
jgi:hypothetical protein